MVTHILEDVLVSISNKELHAMDAAVVLLNEVLELQSVITRLEEAHVLCIIYLLLREVSLEVLEVSFLDRADKNVEAHIISLVKAVEDVKASHRMIIKAHNWCIDIDKEAPLGVLAVQAIEKCLC